MFLDEQIYKKLNRLYFHGQETKTRDLSLKIFSCYYLTTDPYYAFQYSGKEGFIKVHRLKKCLNICNLKSKLDRRKIEDFCRKNNLKDVEPFLNVLSEEDWFNCFKEKKYRELFIDSLQALGYDGFFNIECQDPVCGKLKRSENVPGFSSIGIFDESNLIDVEILHGLDEFLKLESFRKNKKEEINYFKNNLFNICKENNGKLDVAEVNRVIKSISTLPCRILTQEELLEILNTYDFEKEQYQIQESRKNHLEAWWMRKVLDTEVQVTLPGTFPGP